MKQKYCISVDWFEVSCKCPKVKEGLYTNEAFQLNNEFIGTETYNLIKEDGKTAIFEETYSVTVRGKKFATILAVPRTPVIDSTTIQIKVENKALYTKPWCSMLYGLIHAIGARYNNLTRLDVCLDCNYLADGKDVHNFLKQYMLTQAGEANHIVRVGNSRFSMQGIKSWYDPTNISYMRWGSPNSKVKAYCYNKSLEMVEVKDKPYIRDKWVANGLSENVDWKAIKSLSDEEKRKLLDSGNLYRYVKTPVWRFELSIGSEMTRCINLDEQDVFRLSPSYFLAQGCIEQIFFDYAEKYLSFRISNGKKNKRFYDVYKLFDRGTEISIKPERSRSRVACGRTEKMMYKKLKELREEFNEEWPVDGKSFREVANWLFDIGLHKNMEVKRCRDEASLFELLDYIDQLEREGL